MNHRCLVVILIVLLTACSNAPSLEDILPTATTIQLELPTVYVAPTLTSTATKTPVPPTATPPPPANTLPPTTEPPATTPMNADSSAHSLTGGRWIAYSLGEKQNRRNLMLLDLSTGTVNPLTNHRAGDISPVFTADGETLVFVGCRPDCDLYSINLSGSQETRLTDLPIKVMFPDVCRDPAHQWVVFEGRVNDANINVWLFEIDTQKTRQLTHGKADFRPAWSPDCSKILFERTNALHEYGDIFALDLATNAEEQITFTPNADEPNFAWSQDGQWIAFTRVSGDTNRDGAYNLNDRADLFLMRPDGTNQTQLPVNGLSVFAPSWSSDSQDILFVADYPNTNQGDLWIYHLQSGELERLTDLDYYFHPRWSP